VALLLLLFFSERRCGGMEGGSGEGKENGGEGRVTRTSRQAS
jgi:hypothetical protein